MKENRSLQVLQCMLPQDLSYWIQIILLMKTQFYLQVFGITKEMMLLLKMQKRENLLILMKKTNGGQAQSMQKSHLFSTKVRA